MKNALTLIFSFAVAISPQTTRCQILDVASGIASGEVDLSKYTSAWSNGKFEIFYRDVWAIEEVARYYAIKNLTPQSFREVRIRISAECEKETKESERNKTILFQSVKSLGIENSDLQSIWCRGKHTSARYSVESMKLESENSESDAPDIPKSNSTTSSYNPLNHEQTMAKIEADRKKRAEDQARWQREYEAEQRRKREAQYNKPSQGTSSYTPSSTGSQTQQQSTYQQQEQDRQQQERERQQRIQNQAVVNEMNRVSNIEKQGEIMSNAINDVSTMVGAAIAQAQRDKEARERREALKREAQHEEKERKEEEERIRLENEQRAKRNFINSIESQWPTSSLDPKITLLYFFVAAVTSESYKPSNVIAVGRNANRTWPARSELMIKIESEIKGNVGGDEIKLVGYFDDFETAEHYRIQLAAQASELGFLTSERVLIPYSFGNKTYLQDVDKDWSLFQIVVKENALGSYQAYLADAPIGIHKEAAELLFKMHYLAGKNDYYDFLKLYEGDFQQYAHLKIEFGEIINGFDWSKFQMKDNYPEILIFYNEHNDAAYAIELIQSITTWELGSISNQTPPEGTRSRLSVFTLYNDKQQGEVRKLVKANKGLNKGVTLIAGEDRDGLIGNFTWIWPSGDRYFSWYDNGKKVGSIYFQFSNGDSYHTTIFKGVEGLPNLNNGVYRFASENVVEGSLDYILSSSNNDPKVNHNMAFPTYTALAEVYTYHKTYKKMDGGDNLYSFKWLSQRTKSLAEVGDNQFILKQRSGIISAKGFPNIGYVIGAVVGLLIF